MTGDSAISVRGLSKKYGPITAVRDLSFQVPRGAVFGFLGPNGAGKTTAIRMLLGLVQPTAGEIEIFGHDIKRGRAEVVRRIGAIVETPTFHPFLTGNENLDVIARSSGVAPDRGQKRRALLEKINLAPRADEKVAGYSLGMKQRLGLGAALLCDPDLIILDEPTNGLDPEGAVEMRTLIQGFAAEGKTVLISSHLLAEIERVCSEVLILKAGAAIKQFPILELLQQRSGFDLKVSSSERALVLLGSLASAQGATHIHIGCTEAELPAHLRTLLTKGVEVFAAQPVRASLEELFLEVTA